jgi:hypothetical protein
MEGEKGKGREHYNWEGREGKGKELNGREVKGRDSIKVFLLLFNFTK